MFNKNKNVIICWKVQTFKLYYYYHYSVILNQKYGGLILKNKVETVQRL